MSNIMEIRGLDTKNYIPSTSILEKGWILFIYYYYYYFVKNPSLDEITHGFNTSSRISRVLGLMGGGR